MLLNQALMMFWEAILENSVLVSSLLLLLVIAWLVWGVKGRSKHWKHLTSIVMAFVVAAIGFFLLPMFFNAGFDDMNYWVDGAFHLAMVTALFIYAYLILLPLLTALTHGANSSH